MRSADLRPLSYENLDLLRRRCPRAEVVPVPVEFRDPDGTCPALAIAAGALRPPPAPPPKQIKPKAVTRPIPRHEPNENLAKQLMGMSTLSDLKISQLTNVPETVLREWRKACAR